VYVLPGACRRGYSATPEEVVECQTRILATTSALLTTFLRQCKPKAGTSADVLAVAQQLGYAEADPSADVDGLDAADKIATP